MAFSHTLWPDTWRNTHADRLKRLRWNRAWSPTEPAGNGILIMRGWLLPDRSPLARICLQLIPRSVHLSRKGPLLRTQHQRVPETAACPLSAWRSNCRADKQCQLRSFTQVLHLQLWGNLFVFSCLFPFCAVAIYLCYFISFPLHCMFRLPHSKIYLRIISKRYLKYQKQKCSLFRDICTCQRYIIIMDYFSLIH